MRNMAGHLYFSKFNFVCNFSISIANGEREFLFAYRASCSGVMKSEAGFCSKKFTLLYIVFKA